MGRLFYSKKKIVFFSESSKVLPIVGRFACHTLHMSPRGLQLCNHLAARGSTECYHHPEKGRQEGNQAKYRRQEGV
jgi:hypothetical protein